MADLQDRLQSVLDEGAELLDGNGLESRQRQKLANPTIVTNNLTSQLPANRENSLAIVNNGGPPEILCNVGNLHRLIW